MITKQVKEYQLKFDSDMFMITKRLYLEIFAELNLISDYNNCRKYVRSAMSKCLNEITEVKTFETKKIHIEL